MAPSSDLQLGQRGERIENVLLPGPVDVQFVG